jgi:sialate O-acetylesterase
LATDAAVLRAAAEDQADFRPYGSHRLARWGLGRAAPSQLYESLVVPLAHLRIDGLLWYQGESNADSVEEAVEYRAWLVALIDAYRELWGRPELPVVVVQLPEYWDPGTEEGRAWEALRKSQAEAVRETVRTALADTGGLGDPRDIHPKRKREVGQRATTAAAQLLSTPHRCAPEVNESNSR